MLNSDVHHSKRIGFGNWFSLECGVEEVGSSLDLFGGRGLLFEEQQAWAGSVCTLFPSLASLASISTLVFSIKRLSL